jgi:hypothetical protein
VKYALYDAAKALGLKQSEISFNQELKAFSKKADIWIVFSHGQPKGLVEVKKPRLDIMEEPNLYGQVLSNLLELRSFVGLKDVFGIVTTYEQWRFCWLPSCDQVAAASEFKSRELPSLQPIETDFEEATSEIPIAFEKKTIKKEIHVSKVFQWDDKELSKMLCSLLKKM